MLNFSLAEGLSSIYPFIFFLMSGVPLTKNAVVPLVKPDGTGIKSVRLGCQWDVSAL